MNLTTDFAFEGFRILRQRPILFLIWGIFMLLVSAASLYAMIALSGGALNELEAASAGAATDPAALLGVYAKLAPAYGAILPISLISSAISVTAVIRAVLQPQNSAFGYLRFGGDELRMGLLMVVMFFVWIGIVIAIELIALMASMAFAALGGALNIPALGGILAFLVVVCALVVLVIAAVRLSLNGVQTFDTKKLNLFGTAKLTDGKVGTLFVGYLIAFVLVILVYLLLMIVYFGIAAVISKGDMAAMGQVFGGQLYSLEGLVSPLMIVYMVLIGGIGSPVMMAVMYAAPAAAYKALVGTSPAKVADTF